MTHIAKIIETVMTNINADYAKKLPVKCPRCGCTEHTTGHHEGDWYLPEFSWLQCDECDLRFGGDGAYENVTGKEVDQ